MNQPHWTVTRRWISHPGAHRRWDKAYQLLLDMTLRHAHISDGFSCCGAAHCLNR